MKDREQKMYREESNERGGNKQKETVMSQSKKMRVSNERGGNRNSLGRETVMNEDG